MEVQSHSVALHDIPVHPMLLAAGRRCRCATPTAAAGRCWLSGRPAVHLPGAASGSWAECGLGPLVELAVGETVILLHPPSTVSRFFNMDENGGVSKMTELSPTAQVEWGVPPRRELAAYLQHERMYNFPPRW